MLTAKSSPSTGNVDGSAHTSPSPNNEHPTPLSDAGGRSPSMVEEPSQSGSTSTIAPSSSVPVTEPVAHRGVELEGPPFLFRPTEQGFGINVVLKAGEPEALGLRLLSLDGTSWSERFPAEPRAVDVAEWELDGLTAGRRYTYRIVETTNDETEDRVVYEGSGVTQRPPGETYSFALLSDSHIGYNLGYANQGNPQVLADVGGQLSSTNPDFIVNLGDMVDFHQFGFNAPPPDGSITRGAYLNYRAALGDVLGNATHFNVIGNWEGENGNYSPQTIQWSREARMLYMPGPTPETYGLGGSPGQDYYAFTWGDATFFVLNVMSYTPTEHLLSEAGGEADDWTLGSEQMAWFRGAVAAASSRWKFVLIHHAVGGKAGNEANARYGRGGGLAAEVGEQATVHQLMKDNGVQIFFYGHDHVFVDMTVDGIHYTEVGASGAPWKFTTAETGYTDYWSESGWARVDVSSASVRVSFLSDSGVALYDYTLE